MDTLKLSIDPTGTALLLAPAAATVIETVFAGTMALIAGYSYEQALDDLSGQDSRDRDDAFLPPYDQSTSGTGGSGNCSDDDAANDPIYNEDEEEGIPQDECMVAYMDRLEDCLAKGSPGGPFDDNQYQQCLRFAEKIYESCLAQTK